ncbi:hypothetical protein AVEN_144445-1 [Araneus ventricosus]|uniref:Uncharacterized protein n=1 Tax=Araneus ventricosus TaxID=182803 RepID=A0A4Y2E0T7_ARAVE|nr:hypothetical protein AVEN_144445-1 [Araneus ventricosus]
MVLGGLTFPNKSLKEAMKSFLTRCSFFSTVVVARLLLVVADGTANDFIVRQYWIARVIEITFEPILNFNVGLRSSHWGPRKEFESYAKTPQKTLYGRSSISR